MRDALTRLLYRHYPGLYRQAKLTMSQTSMCRGFSCHDGWFALLDALSETIIAIDPECQAVQVKEKFGTLRFYRSGNHDGLSLAVGTAELYSSRVCERTGAPGDLMRTTSNWGLYATLSTEGIELLNAAAGMARAFKPVGEDAGIKLETATPADTFQIPLAAARASWSRTEAIAFLKKRHEHALAVGCVIDIPPGGFDLADAVISAASRRFQREGDRTGKPAPKIARMIWGDASGMSVKIDETSLPAAAQHDIDCMSDISNVVHVEDWWIRRIEDAQGEYYCLAARTMTGHPVLGDTNLAHSSPLVWLDERAGYARTVSRLYHLGRRSRNHDGWHL